MSINQISESAGRSAVATAGAGFPQPTALAVALNSVVADSSRGAPAPRSISSLDLAGPASADSALSSELVSDIAPEIEAAITALEMKWLRAGIVMNATASRTRAAIINSSALSSDIANLVSRA
jgi:hypothetical protein